MTAPHRDAGALGVSSRDMGGRVLLFDSGRRGNPVARQADDSSVGYSMSTEHVSQLVRLAVRHEWDVGRLVRAARISLPPHRGDCVEFTRRNVALAIQHLWASTGDDLAGLGSAPLPRGSLRMVAFALGGAPTLADALRRYEEFRAVLAGLPGLTLEPCAAGASLSIHLDSGGAPAGLVGDMLLAVIHRIINWAIRRPMPLRSVELPHPAVGATDYRLVFGAPAEFCSTRAALVFSADVLAEPLVRSHDEIARFFMDAPTALLAECDFYTSHSDRVRRIVEDRIGVGCTVDDIASVIGMSRPTLRRRLREEGTSISEIRDQVLHQAALEGLAGGRESITELSQRLGFSEPSAFTRAFRRWTGCSPSRYQSH